MAEPQGGISIWSCLVLAAMGAYIAVGVVLSLRYGWGVGLAMAVLWFGLGIYGSRRYARLDAERARRAGQPETPPKP